MSDYKGTILLDTNKYYNRRNLLFKILILMEECVMSTKKLLNETIVELEQNEQMSIDGGAIGH